MRWVIKVLEKGMLTVAPIVALPVTLFLVGEAYGIYWMMQLGAEILLLLALLSAVTMLRFHKEMIK